jgi:hypothetical protein
MIKGKHILWGLGLAGGIGGIAYLLNLNRLSGELEIITKALIHKATLSGLVVRVDVTLKNPSGGSVRVKHPFVKLAYGGSTFATSQVQDKDYELPKYGEKAMEPIFIDLSFLNLATNVPEMLKEYRTKGKLNLDVTTVTTINNKLPYNDTQQIAIGQGEQNQEA